MRTTKKLKTKQEKKKEKIKNNKLNCKHNRKTMYPKTCCILNLKYLITFCCMRKKNNKIIK